jgi:hypothetical protein
MRLSFTTKAVIALALFAGILSLVKFDHCYNTNWSGVGVDVHECYSDLPALFDARGLVDHLWPYSSATNSVEYPPLTGVVMWATAVITPHGYNADKYYYLINILFLAALFIGTAIIVSKINPSKWYLLPLLPAVIASLYINWDMWAVISAVAAIYWFDRQKYRLSSAALAISIATKFFPVVLLIPIAIIFFHRGEIREGLRYLVQTVGLWIVINAPFALTTPTGWWRFFKLNGSRPADLGSLWQALNIFGLNISGINFYWIALFLVGALAAAGRLLRRELTPTLAQSAFIFVALFTALNKVYSPQYVLWLAPLGVIALIDKRDRAAFWFWQGSEAIYHFAIWEYLATYGGSKFSLPTHWYAGAILLRVAASLYFAWRLLTPKAHLSTTTQAPQEEKFLQSEIEG